MKIEISAADSAVNQQAEVEAALVPQAAKLLASRLLTAAVQHASELDERYFSPELLVWAISVVAPETIAVARDVEERGEEAIIHLIEDIAGNVQFAVSSDPILRN